MRNFRHWRLLKVASISAALSGILYPASSFAGPPDYGFKIVGRPSGTTVSVELVDRNTEQPAANAQLYTMRWVYGFGKGIPTHQVRVPLKANGDGTFVADARPGDELQLFAVVPGNADKVTGSVFVGS